MLADQDAGRPNLTSREMGILIAWLHTESKELVAQKPFISPSTNGSAPSTRPSDGKPEPNLRWWPGPFKTASSPWTISDPKYWL